MWLLSTSQLGREKNSEITDLLDNPQDAEFQTPTLFISECIDAWKLELNCKGAYKQPMQLQV